MILVAILLPVALILAVWASVHVATRAYYVRTWRGYASEWDRYGRLDDAARCRAQADYYGLPWWRALVASQPPEAGS